MFKVIYENLQAKRPMFGGLSTKQKAFAVYTYSSMTAGLLGGIIGASYSGLSKIGDSLDENNVYEPAFYKISDFERPLRPVYTIGRVVGSVGIGFVVGGLSAATFPISVPVYHAFIVNRKKTCEIQQLKNIIKHRDDKLDEMYDQKQKLNEQITELNDQLSKCDKK